MSTTSPAPGKLVVKFSNASMATHAGIFVGANATCSSTEANTAVIQMVGHVAVPLNFIISGDSLAISCNNTVGVVKVNSDYATCFLYGTQSGLPAPPVEFNCTAAHA